ncbi:MAG: LuxR C-terminal-related transcriptional regulator [Dermatophilaceae bacterium]
MLSGREVEVLDLLAAGKTNAEIASSLFVPPKTAKTTSPTSSPNSAAPASRPLPAPATPASATLEALTASFHAQGASDFYALPPSPIWAE